MTEAPRNYQVYGPDDEPIGPPTTWRPARDRATALANKNVGQTYMVARLQPFQWLTYAVSV